ncbi:hypothetical protein PMPD1_0211 [Paramixta manurensis]|uniref:Fimbrial-type adhesion domain-containing protein n=1 Tax=Paramixta manurensis TaxID=2740817 RepID=A0A6M8U6Q9_9GAMM|nr:hypothetical protein PMPD1_0211 [Erwiniaceae bacterium PD-1]
MNKLHYVLAPMMVIGSLVSQQSYSATSAALNINGKVISATCAIDINGVSDATVTLPATLASSFSSTNQVRENAPFTINITNCTDVSPGALTLTLTRNTPTSASVFEVPNIGGSAREAALAIYDTAGVVRFNGTTAVAAVPDLNAGKATLNYSVKYLSIDYPVNAGTVKGSLKVELTYK